MSNEVCHRGHTRWFHCWLLLSCKYSYICNYTQLNEGTSPQLYANIDQHCPSQPRPSAYCKGHVSAQQSSEAHKTLNIKTLWEKVGSLVNFVTPVGEGATSRSQRYKWAIRSKVTRHNMSHVPTGKTRGCQVLGPTDGLCGLIINWTCLARVMTFRSHTTTRQSHIRSSSGWDYWGQVTRDSCRCSLFSLTSFQGSPSEAEWCWYHLLFRCFREACNLKEAGGK